MPAILARGLLGAMAGALIARRAQFVIYNDEPLHHVHVQLLVQSSTGDFAQLPTGEARDFPLSSAVCPAGANTTSPTKNRKRTSETSHRFVREAP